MAWCDRCKKKFSKKGKFQKICEACNKQPSWIKRLKLYHPERKRGERKDKRIRNLKIMALKNIGKNKRR